MQLVIALIAVAILAALVAMWSYYFLVLRRRWREYSYPPKPQYDRPSYRPFGTSLETPVTLAPEPETDVVQIAGIPRCPECGAAISAHDWECDSCGNVLRDYRKL